MTDDNGNSFKTVEEVFNVVASDFWIDYDSGEVNITSGAWSDTWYIKNLSSLTPTDRAAVEAAFDTIANVFSKLEVQEEEPEEDDEGLDS